MTTNSWAEVLEAASGDVRRLSHVVRYSSIPVAVPENVAEHSYWVCLYSALIHRVLKPDNLNLYGAILLKATTHDIAECVTGDVVRTFKYSSMKLKEEINKAENKIIQEFAKPIEALINNIQDSLAPFDDRTYIDTVVKAADFMSLHQYMIREVRRGNREIINPFYMRMEEDLKSMATVFSKHMTPESILFNELYSEMVRTAKTARNGG
jgi:5'-deoxynucleotidase YfbR-like HD superfamily hydrolase